MNLKEYQPKAAFSQKHLLTLADYSTDDIHQVLQTALALKEQAKENIPHPILAGKVLAMIFTKPSMRTRVSFETGIYQLGGHGLVLTDAEIGLGTRETVEDVAKVLSRMVDGIMIRTFKQSDVEGLAKNGSVPVINALTDDYHPCQVLADLLTIYEHKQQLKGLKLAFVGDGNNMANSLMLGCAKVGMDVAIGAPKGYLPNPAVVETAKQAAAAFGSQVIATTDPIEAVKGADVVYTDVWASMGQESEKEQRARDFSGYCVDEALFSGAKGDALFLHCLPAHRGEEVSAGVIDGPRSVVFDEAENRLHAQKAVLALLMGAD